MLEWPFQIILLFLFILASFSYIPKKIQVLRRYKELMERIPGPKPGWLLGSAFEYVVSKEHLSGVYDNQFKEFGSIVRVWYVSHLDAGVFVTRPNFLEIILTSTKHIKKSTSYEKMTSWLGTGLLTSTGSKWFLHRKLITPTFHFKILEDFFQVFVERSEVLVKKLEKLAGDSVVDLMPVISRCALDIICETAMGTQLSIEGGTEHEDYVKTIYEVNELVIYRDHRIWLSPDIIYYNTAAGKKYRKCLQVLHGFTEKVIQGRKLQRKEDKVNLQRNVDDNLPGYKKKLALLDLLLDTCETDQPLTDLEIREEVDTFMFEGHDTTAMAITWTLYLLGRHPDIQQAVVEELESIFTETACRCTQKDLSDMKYLERVIKESLRLYPSVPMIARRVEEDLQLGEYTIPAHTNVTLDIFHLHRDPKLFPNPEKFNPDNFLPENTRKRHPYAYIPFSAGPRNCIGQRFALMEVKTVIAHILRNFRIEAIEEAPPLLLELTLKPANGLLAKLTPRKH